MKPYEREMFLYPRVCDGCRMDDGTQLSECAECHSVFYCCDQHLSKDHQVWCKELKILLDLNVEQSKKGRIDCMLPHQLLETFEEFPPSLKVSTNRIFLYVTVYFSNNLFSIRNFLS